MKMNLSDIRYWKINNKESEYRGDLYLNEDEGGIMLNIRIPHKESTISSLKIPFEIPFIVGTTISNAEITLVNCSRISTVTRVGSETEFRYEVEFMFEGASFDEEKDLKFSKMILDVPGIIQWGDVSNYVRPNLSQRGDSLIDLNIIEPTEIYSNKTYKISYHLTYSSPYDFMKEEITLKQKPQFIIEAQSPQKIEWFMKTANNMRRLIEIAIGSPLNYGSMSVETPEFYYEMENGKKQIWPLKVIHAHKYDINIESESKRLMKHDYLFRLSELKEANFSQWQKVADIMEPIIELYIESLYNENLSVSRHFLNMVQALETYHSRRIVYSLTDYKRRVEDVLKDNKKTGENYKNDKKLFLADSRSFVVLKSRITDLLVAEYKFIFNLGDFKLVEFPQLIVNTRNYYTHYDQKDKKILEGQDLITAFYELRNILEFYLLKELGFKEEFIHERIRGRWRK